MAFDYDLVVIGSGPGGYVAAIRAAQLGLRTACVEYEETLGGTCLNVGCIPSKALLQSSEHFHQALHEFGRHGIKMEKVTLDLPSMMKRKDDVVKGLTSGISGLFKKNKVTWLKGRGSFLSEHEIEVKGTDTQKVTARNIIIATGSKPIEIPSAKFDRKKIVSSTGALKFESVPEHLIVVGGGVIGLEMGSVWLRLGAKVSLIEATSTLLPGVEPALSQGLMKVLQKQGMQFYLNSKLQETKVHDKGVMALMLLPDGTTQTLQGDKMLVAVGRKPNTEGLGLEKAGLSLDPRGRIPVDSHLRTKHAHIYAIGDVIQGPMLAHKAEEEGIAAAETIAGGSGHVNYLCIPGVVYTWPELAWVGLTEAEAQSKGYQTKTGQFPFTANGRAKASGHTDGLVKIVSDAQTDKVLGAHILGPNASELISELTLAMEFSASSEDIARTSHAHPTLSEAVKEAALGALKRTIHF